MTKAIWDLCKTASFRLTGTRPPHSTYQLYVSWGWTARSTKIHQFFRGPICKKKGFVLLEAVLVLGLASLFLSTVGGLAYISVAGVAHAHQAELAAWAVNEGIDATRTLTFADLPFLSNGAIAFVNNRWQLSATGPQTIATGITRTITVAQVFRDTSCNVVTSGGTVDTDSKKITSVVTWLDNLGRSHTLTNNTLKTQWGNPQGSCFHPSMASNANIDISQGEWFGGKQLRTVFVSDTGSSPVTIDRVTFTWTNSKKIQQMFIGTTKVWSASGPGTPSNDQPSATQLNIQDFTLNPGQTFEINKTQFSGNMEDTTLTITFVFTDGTSLATPPFTPHD